MNSNKLTFYRSDFEDQYNLSVANRCTNTNITHSNGDFEPIDFWSLIHVPQSINQCTIRPHQNFCLSISRWQRFGRDSVCDNQVQQRTVLYQVDPEDEGGGLCHHQRRRGVHVYILILINYTESLSVHCQHLTIYS